MSRLRALVRRRQRTTALLPPWERNASLKDILDGMMHTLVAPPQPPERNAPGGAALIARRRPSWRWSECPCRRGRKG